jgi:prepilin-type N-terminal cleavage/methylation domain-containing protein
MKTSPAPRSQTPPRRRGGFTLIELLTVIAVIGVLAAILIPTVGAVRKKARESRSLSNIRQLGLAMLSYADDNKGKLFLKRDENPAAPLQFWSQKLSPYIGAVATDLVAFDGRRYQLSITMVDPLLTDDQHHPFGDYGCNTAIIQHENRDFSPMSYSAIRAPSRIASVMTAFETRPGGNKIGTWYVESAAYVVRPETFTDRQPSGRDGGPVITAFFDGSARAIVQTEFFENRRSLLLNE